MEIQANKNQTLEYHLRKISEEILLLNNNGEGYVKIFNNSKEILVYTNALIGLLHDIGKTSIYFQNRLKNNIFGKKKKVLVKEYHNWGYLFIKDILNKFFKEKEILIDDILLETVGYASSISILNHHFDLSNGSKIDKIDFLQKGEGYFIDFDGQINEELKLKEYITLLFDKDVINNQIINNIFFEINKNTENQVIKELSKFLSSYNFNIDIFNNFGENQLLNIFGTLGTDEEIKNETYLFNESLINRKIALQLVNFIFLPNLIFIDKKISIKIPDSDFVEYNTSDNNLIEDYYIKKFPLEKSKGLNFLRGTFFNDIHSNIDKKSKIHIIEAPAGIGKFLSLTSYATKLLDKDIKKIVYIAPFVSILDQNAEVLKTNILNKIDDINDKSFSKINYLTKKRYITHSKYNNIDNIENDKYTYLERYMLTSLNSKYVFTTFVNIFNSLFGFKNINYVQTLNLLNNSILIIDEIQDFNKENLYFLKYFLEEIVPNHNIKIVLSSATLPIYIYKDIKEDFFFYSYYNETKHIQNENDKFFNRINLELLTEKEIDISYNIKDFSYKVGDTGLYSIIQQKIEGNKRVLFINNTIKGSEKVGKNILEKLGLSGKEGEILEGGDNKKYIYYFLNNKSKNKFEKDILIDKIKNHDDKSILLVFSTQLIKAGVDIDMDICFSDFFNLFDLTQIGGRINRNNKRNNDNKLYVYALESGKNYDFEKIAGDNDSNSSGLFIEYITKYGLHNHINEQYLYNIELNNFNKFISDRLDIKNYDLIFNMLDYEEISKESKLIKENKEEITYVKDLNNFLFINEKEKVDIELFLNNILENKKIIDEEITLKGKKYSLQSFLNTINKYDIENYNLGEYYTGKTYNIYREINDFII